MGNNIPAVFSLIAAKRNDLTISENEIAKFVLKNPEYIINNTITNIAKKIGVSETSINRFCKKIGYKGFQSFKIALIQENLYREIKTEESDKPQSSMLTMLNDYKKILDNTFAMIEKKNIQRAVQYIKEGHNIYVFDNYNPLNIAKYVQKKLQMLGIDVTVIDNWMTMKLTCSKCQNNDVFITCFSTLCSASMIESLLMVNQKKGKNIVITSYDSQKMSEISDVKIVTADKLYIKNKESLSGEIAFIFIIDLLLMYLLEDEKYLQEKKKSETILEDEEISNSYYFYL